MATDWSGRDAALEHMQKMVKLCQRMGDEDVEHYREAVNALRRSQDHTAIQTKLNAAMKLLREIAENPDCASASCGIACKEFVEGKPGESHG